MEPTQLSPQMVSELKQAEREMLDYLPELDKAEQCGLDVSGYRTVIDQATGRIRKIIQHFAPPAQSG